MRSARPVPVSTDYELSLVAASQMLTFEAFRDLVKLLQQKVPEELGILMAEDENIAMRAAAKADAAAAQGNAEGRHAALPAAGDLLVDSVTLACRGWSYMLAVVC